MAKRTIKSYLLDPYFATFPPFFRKILPGFLYTGTKQMKDDMLSMESPFEPSTHLEYTTGSLAADGLLDRLDFCAPIPSHH